MDEYEIRADYDEHTIVMYQGQFALRLGKRR